MVLGARPSSPGHLRPKPLSPSKKTVSAVGGGARLSEDQQDWTTYVVDAFTHFGEEAGKRYAARLPPAPRCPL
jgi:hypothetical protein